MPSDRAVDFVNYITKICRDNPGARADLRSGLGRTVDTAPRMHCYLVPFTGSDAPHTAAVLYTVASLIAVNPNDAVPERSPGSLGTSIGLAGHLAENTRESSVHLLTRQSTNQLCRALTRVLLPLRQQSSKTVAVDFARLTDDATAWRTKRQRIGSQWLQDYYRTVLRVTKDAAAL